jgi:hypothetical protein
MKKDLRVSRSRQIATVAIAVVTAIIAACSDAAAPSAPTAAPERSISPEVESALARAHARASWLPESYIAQGLLREKPLTKAVSVTKTISNRGGSIDVPGTDFQLRVPRGAFPGRSMTFTVTALPGAAVAYEFEPKGARFFLPLQFVQRLGHTNLKHVKLPPGFQPDVKGAYFTDASMIDPTTGIAVVAELLPADVRATWTGDQLTFPIWHFSGYMASMGRGGYR